MMVESAAPAAVGRPEPGEGETAPDDTGDIRALVEKRLRKAAGEDDDDEEEEES
jgi:hypothetical protein